jgi:hypothetical protein
VLDFLMGYESYLRYKPTGKHPCIFACKVVDVFSFHWFIAPPSRRYFQGHSP